MRIVAGDWRGRTLVAPPGQGTRPTADRTRQALFDMLMHADWGGRSAVEGAQVMDVFAGTGAMGLEALSRGAAGAVFIESDATALRALRANVVACKAQDRSLILATDALGLTGVSWPIRPPAHGARSSGSDRAEAGSVAQGSPASLVFLDPPYGKALVPRALSRLRAACCIAEDALIIAETGRDETWLPEQPLLADRTYGAARVLVFRAA